MNNVNGLFSWLIFAAVSILALIASLYIFAFLLPLVVFLIIAGAAINAFSFWRAKRNSVRMKKVFHSQQKKNGIIIDADYEIIDDNYKSNKSE